MMHFATRYILPALLLVQMAGFGQNKIPYNGQQLYLSGSNLAWENFAGDMGPGNLDTARFISVLDQMHQSGGNVLRWWLHTDGTITPSFDIDGYVNGPGSGAIADLKKVLDLAWEREIGVDLCLWSFDMLRKTNSATVRGLNTLMLNDVNYTTAYVDNCLIPMVEAVKGHPAILTWEIFNEPEGMSAEFGWSDIDHVPMSSIQRFTNLCAGAIHRTDTAAIVTNGAWSFYALCDAPILNKSTEPAKVLTAEEKHEIGLVLKAKYRSSLTPEAIVDHLQKIAGYPSTQKNYYKDTALIAAGGDPDGTLDFYSVHYYPRINSSYPTAVSPFHHPVGYWNLDKKVVVGEFGMEGSEAPPSIVKTALYDTLYHLGYAGALAWSWTDTAISSSTSMLAGMQSMWDNHRSEVDVVVQSGIIISFSAGSPIIEKGQSTYLKWKTSEGSTVTLDGNGVSFWDSLQVSPDTTTIYELIAQGFFSDTSNATVTVLPPGTIVSFSANPSTIGIGESSLLGWHVVPGSIVKLNDAVVGSDDTLRVYPTGDTTFVLSTAGSVLDTSRVTIHLIDPAGVNRALNQPVTVSSTESGAGVPVDPPRAVDGNLSTRWSSTYADNQWIYVDLGQRIAVQHVVLYWEAAYGQDYNIEISDNAEDWSVIYSTNSGNGGTDDITGISGTGRYVRMNGLVRGTEWGFSLYEFEVYGLPVPAGIGNSDMPVRFSLSQNYPNPFNPETNIKYSLFQSGKVKLVVYDILGRQIATLVDKIQNAGNHEIPFNASALTSGVYFYRITAGTFVQTRKMVLMK